MTYSCSPGYTLVGDATISCIADTGSTGKWSGAAPFCQSKQCPDLGTPTGGTYSYTLNREYDATVGDASEALITCSSGFSHTAGAHTCSTESGGTPAWTGALPTCTEIACLNAPAADGNGVRTADGTALSGSTGYHDTVLTYTCNEGFTLAPGVADIVTCGANGAWSNAATPTCNAAVCPGLAAPANGYVEYSSVPFTYSAANPVTATYRCTVGYTISTFASAVCSAAGAGTVAWSAVAAPTCTRATCAAFEDAWIGIGVQKDAANALSIVDPARQVDWLNPVFGDQLAFSCIDPTAVKGGPSSPTCVASTTGASGAWLPVPSAAAQVLCKCQPGSYMVSPGGTCTECGANTFSSEAGALVCTPCDPSTGESSAPGSAFCERASVECPEGTYKDRTKAACLSCPKKGAICEDNEITLLKNWWFDADKLKANNDEEVSATTQMLGCLNELACKTDTINVTVTCNTGYSGVLCGACELESGYMRSGQLCRECDSFLYNVVFVSAMAALGIGYVLYVIAFQNFSTVANDQRPVVIKIAMSFCQMLTVLGVFKARGTALFNELVQRPASIAGGGISSALPLKCILNSQIYGSFILNLATPPAIALLTALLIVPVWVCKRAQEAERASRPPLSAPTTKLNVLLCRCEQVTAGERYVWLHARTSSSARSKFRAGPRFVAVLVFVLFGIYPTLVKSVFSVFRCSEPISGKMYLEDDFTVQCWVGWHPMFVAFAVGAGFVYLLGIPFGLLLILSFNRHRLAESRFISTFGFVYNGYHTDRGTVVAWESFVMLRKLAVTAITVSSSDPYIQIFVALLLLIVSYGLQERVMPFETEMLNNIEGMGLFSLIFTQIVSIMYLYIDSRAAETGEKDVVLEYIVTIVLMFANVVIVVAMVGAYLAAAALHLRASSKVYREFHELQTEPNGPLTTYRNPRVEPQERLKVFRTLTHVTVYLHPFTDSETTGEIAETGDVVVVSESRSEYVRARCAKGRFVEWLKRADGTGWMIDRNLRTGDPELELIGHKDDDGSIRQSFWRFEVVSSAPVPIRAGISSAPFVWLTGESLAPGESVLVDIRFLRTYPCSKRTVTFLHLADRRGWIVEPSTVPDTDWLALPAYVDHSVLARLVRQEEHPRLVGDIAISEYTTLCALSIYKQAAWPLEVSIANLKAGETFFVDDRQLLSKRWHTVHAAVGDMFWVTLHLPRLRGMGCRTQRVANMLQLADGRGFVLASARETGASNVQFRGLRIDSVDEKGSSLVRWRYTVAAHTRVPVRVYPTRVEAGASSEARGRRHGRVKLKRPALVDTAPDPPPLAPLATVVIQSKHLVNTCVVGEIVHSESAGANGPGFVVLGESLELETIYLAIAEDTVVSGISTVPNPLRATGEGGGDSDAVLKKKQRKQQQQADRRVKRKQKKAQKKARQKLAMAAATTRTSGDAVAIEMTSMPMKANPMHRDAVSAGGLKVMPPAAGGVASPNGDASPPGGSSGTKGFQF